MNKHVLMVPGITLIVFGYLCIFTKLASGRAANMYDLVVFVSVIIGSLLTLAGSMWDEEEEDEDEDKEDKKP